MTARAINILLRKLMYFVLGSLLLSPVFAEKIIFSGRNGQRVSFDFSVRKPLLPAGLEEPDLGQSRSDSPGASLFNLSAPAVTPTAGQSRRDKELLDRRRNWMFQETDSFLIGQSESDREKKEPELFGGEESPDSMRRFMEKGFNGDKESDANRSAGDPERRESRQDAGRRESTLNSIRSGPLTQTLPGTGLSQPAVMLEAQPLSGADNIKLDRMDRISAAFKKEGLELQSKADIESFRKMINNPFQNSGSGFNNSFGQSDLKAGVESLPGVQITRGLRPTAGIGAPAARGSAFGGANPAFGVGAFNSRGPSLSSPGSFGSEASRPIKLAPRPIILDIPKRDF